MNAALAFSRFVVLGVQLDSRERQRLANVRAQRRVVLADPAGEDNRIRPAQLDQVGAEIIAYGRGEDLQRQLCPLVTRLGG